MKITTDAVMTTDPCPDYPRERVEALVGAGLNPAEPTTLDAALALPRGDARLVLSRLLTTTNAVAWGRGCADRAREYATGAGYTSFAYAHISGNAAQAAAVVGRYAADAVTRANYAARAADYAARAAHAHFAAFTSRAAARADAEHKTACQHALSLIESQP